MSDVTVRQIRHELLLCQKRIRRIRPKNKLKYKYHSKICYMLMHLRMIPCERNTIEGWIMPDYGDIAEMRKRGIMNRGIERLRSRKR